MSLVTIPEVFAKVDFKGLVSFLFFKAANCLLRQVFIYLLATSHLPFSSLQAKIEGIWSTIQYTSVETRE